MGRIAIDTREVRSLGRLLEGTAKDLDRTAKRVRDRHSETQLNTERDPRVGQIKPGVNLVENQLNKTTREYNRLSELATRTAKEFEAADQVGPQQGPGTGFWPQLDLPGWFPSPGGIPSPHPIICTAWKVEPAPTPGWLDWFKDGLRAGRTALDTARGGLNKLIKSATNVGKRFISGARGLLGRATSWAAKIKDQVGDKVDGVQDKLGNAWDWARGGLSSAFSWGKDKLQSLISKAWDGIWNGLTTTLKGAADAINGIGGFAKDFILGDLANFWGGGEDGFPWGKIGSAVGKIWRVARGVPPIFNRGLFGRGVALAARLSRIPALVRIGTWIPTASKFFTKLGIAGGVFGTAYGAYNLYQQGNPIDAYQAEGAGYVADVAETAFSASTVAFLVAPNPVTGAFVIGTGVVWIGAEVMDTDWGRARFEDFKTGLGVIGDWSVDRYDDFNAGLGVISDWSTDRWDDFNTGLDVIGDWGSNQVDNFNTGVNVITDWGGNQVDNFNTGVNVITDWGGNQVDNFNDGLDVIGDFGSNQVDNFNDGLEVIGDFGGSVASKADPRNWF